MYEYIDNIRKVLAYVNDVEQRQSALYSLMVVEEELRQSVYYRECRDKWRDQAQGLLNRLETAHCGGCQCDPEGVQ